jgi:membrane-associated phospholipid phosphatase
VTANQPDTAFVEGVDTVSRKKYYKLNKAYILSYWTDLKHVVSRPAHWKGRDFRNFGIFAGITAVTFSVDWDIKRIAQLNQRQFPSEVFRQIEPFGNLYGLYFFPAMYVAGLVTKQPKIESIALGGVKSLAISSLIYGVSKKMIRRSRPDQTDNTFDFAPPFAKSNYNSSPSGHSNTIFTVATALAMEFKETKWVPIVAYTIAGLTAASRIYQNRHWTSDVLVGSALGHFVTKAVWRNNNRQRTPKQLW